LRANVITIPFHAGLTYNLYTLADAHIGNANSCIDDIMDKVRAVENDPLGLLVVNGDMGDYITYTDKRFDPTTIDQDIICSLADLKRLPLVYADFITELLKPVRDKIVCITTGTHELKMAAALGDDPMWMVTKNLGLEHVWGDWACMTTLRFDDGNKHADTFDIFSSHGWQASRQGGAITNNLDSMMGWILCDLLLQAHSHQYIVKHKVVLYAENGNIKQKVVTGAHTGGWLLTYKQVKGGSKATASYAERAGYPPTVIGSPVFRITPSQNGHGRLEG
jgi:hypothetical protein